MYCACYVPKQPSVLDVCALSAEHCGDPGPRAPAGPPTWLGWPELHVRIWCVSALLAHTTTLWTPTPTAHAHWQMNPPLRSQSDRL